MQVPRERVLTLLEGRGESGQGAQAGSGLPGFVDAELLWSVGADPAERATAREVGEPELQGEGRLDGR